MNLSVSAQRRIVQVAEATPGTYNSGGTLVLRSDLSGYAQPADRRQTHTPGGSNFANATGLLEVMSTAGYDMVPYYGMIPYCFNDAFGTGAPYYSSTADSPSAGLTTRVWRLPFNGQRRGVPTQTFFEGLPADALRMTFGFCTELALISDRTGESSGNVGYTFANRLEHTNMPGGTTATLDLVLTGGADGGSFTLTGTNPDDGTTWISSAINVGDTAAQIAVKLNAPNNVPAGAFTATSGTLSGTTHVILTTADGPWDKQPLGTISIGTNSLTVSSSPGGSVTIAGTAGVGLVLVPTVKGLMLPGHVTHTVGPYGDLDTPSDTDTLDDTHAVLLDSVDNALIQRSETRYPNLAAPRIFEVGGMSYNAFTDSVPWNDIRHTYTFADSNSDVFQQILADSLEAGYTNTSGVCDIATSRWWQKSWTCGTTVVKQRIYGNAVAPIGRGDTNGLYTRTIEIAPHLNPSASNAGGCSVEVIVVAPT